VPGFEASPRHNTNSVAILSIVIVIILGNKMNFEILERKHKKNNVNPI
jgi:hypothetical protein